MGALQPPNWAEHPLYRRWHVTCTSLGIVHDTWKLLAPVDLRTEADERVQHARSIGEALTADPTLLYVTSRLPGAIKWPQNATGSRLTRTVLAGPLSSTVARHSEDLGVDMLVLPIRHRPWWKRLGYTPAAAQIAAATDLPICFTRLEGSPPSSHFRSILCELQLDGADDPVIRFSQELARRCDAMLIYLHVLPEVSEALAAYGMLTFDDRPLSEPVALQRLGQLTKHLSQPHLTAIRSGAAARVIQRVAREQSADLIITARRREAAACGYAASVLERVTCPVISVPVESYALPRSTKVAASAVAA